MWWTYCKCVKNIFRIQGSLEYKPQRINKIIFLNRSRVYYWCGYGNQQCKVFSIGWSLKISQKNTNFAKNELQMPHNSHILFLVTKTCSLNFIKIWVLLLEKVLLIHQYWLYLMRTYRIKFLSTDFLPQTTRHI